MLATGIGASVARKEDERFLRGRGQYVADFRIPGTREVAFVRSPVAHARLMSVIIPQRHGSAVITADDLVDVKPIRAASSVSGFKHSREPVLAAGKVRFVGEIVAACVGRSRAEAEDIAASVQLELEELPAVVDMLEARKPETPLVHDDWSDNVFVTFLTDTGIEAAASAAAINVTREIRTARQCMVPLEGRGVVAWWDDRLRYLTLVTATQMPHIVQTGVAECLGLSDGSVRVISPDVGGGFGYKGLLCREEVALGWLALHFGHPVRWVEDCREQLSANANCREHHYQITAYADAEGHLLGIDCEASVDAGAYSVFPTSAALEARMIPSLLPGPYDFGAYRCRATAVATNKCPILPYRGVARSGVCLAIELVMDAVARQAGIEPHEVRLRNLVRPDQMPFDNVVNKHFDSGDYPQCVRRAVAAIDVESVRRRQKRREPDGRLIGVGLSIFCEQGAHGTSVLASWGRPVVPGYEPAVARLTTDGDLEIRVDTHSHGQGHETTFAQIAHEVTGVGFDRIKILQGDTLYTPFSTATWGGCVQGKAGSVTFREVARAWYLEPQHLGPDVDPGGLEVTAGYRAARDSGTFSYAAHAAVVAVDPETGILQILDYVVVEDGGILVNPMIVDGQVRGGTAQGIGTCIYEAMPFDARGQPPAGTLADYLLPGACEVPDIRVFHMETPSPYTSFGAKGIGEGGAIGPPAAIMSAVNDALRGLGTELRDLPLSPHRILDAIKAASNPDATFATATALIGLEMQPDPIGFKSFQSS
jgi:carbon-monoxide dehydrogenase large subunit